MKYRIQCWFRNRRPSKSDEEFIKQKNLERAEAEVAALGARANVAIRVLTERHDRNHWGESVYNMITGSSNR